MIPPVSLRCEDEVRLFAPGASRTVTVEVTAARADLERRHLSLDTPDGWKVTPAKQSFSLASAGEQKKFTFTVTAPPQAATAEITARAKIGGKSYDNERMEISYPHIPLQLLQPPARLKAVCLDLAIRGQKSRLPSRRRRQRGRCLKEMGYEVTHAHRRRPHHRTG